MKRLLPFLFLFSAPVYADIKQEFVTSAQISIDSPYVITNAAPNSYSISGNNITTSTGSGDSQVTNGIGGLNLASITNGLAGVTATNTSVTTAGSAFSFSESYQAGDATQTAITPSSGIATLPVLGGQTTVISGGTAGSLALTSLSSGVHTCTAGGSGTSCIGSTTVRITID
ncbi:hypothetical protein [uncultured Mediterranean phage uvMED]|nr:hypothetical protein [uncultured Mediterranean phage uvMED]BAR21664.1 hypothetical protein [uncultured Mediterranean phage uvMED]BAR21817.1 hypothetical protein [uncultured Mediterranean phage uvMED]BAR38818.1 hypothetical protein [uncultured Mediterranean phage uvMED]